MKKHIIILAAACAAIALVCGCGKKTNSEYENKYSQVGEIISTEGISVVCPNGWNQVEALPVPGPDGEINENTIVLVKAGEAIGEGKPYLKITYYKPGENVYNVNQESYDHVHPVESTMIGNRTWKGFFGAVSDRGFSYVSSAGEDGTFTAYLWMHSGEEVQSQLVDADVQLILGSVKVN